MTVSSTINRTSYNGDGTTTDFAVPFDFFDEDELQVIERVTVTGVETIKSLYNDYTVDSEQSKVVATNAPASTVSWTILCRTKRTQLIDYTDNDPFPAETHERGLDRVTMVAQDSAGAVDRALRFPVTDLPTLNPEIPNSMERAGKYLAFDSEGLPFASAGPAGDSAIPVSSFVEGLLDDADAATARETLGLVIGTDVAPVGNSGDFVGRVAAFVGTVAPSGWLLLNGDTIGNLSSGADHESADYEALFELFWESMADAEAPVSTGRGANAAADWGAGKTLTLPDLRGRTIIGSGTGTGLTARTHGGAGGEEDHLLTAAESGVPSHSHPPSSKNFVLTTNLANDDFGSGSSPGGGLGGGSVSATTGNNTGSNASLAHNNMQPFLSLNFIVKYL